MPLLTVCVFYKLRFDEFVSVMLYLKLKCPDVTSVLLFSFFFCCFLLLFLKILME